MSMHGSTIRILEAAHFPTPQALAIAEAIDTGIRSADLVTAPLLSSRLAETEARIDARLMEQELRIVQKTQELLSGYFWKTLGLCFTMSGLILAAMRYLR